MSGDGLHWDVFLSDDIAARTDELRDVIENDLIVPPVTDTQHPIPYPPRPEDIA